MATYVAQVQTPWTAEKVFSYLADLENLEQWDPGVSSAKIVQGTKGEDGATYDVSANKAKLRYKITDYQKPSLVGFEAKTRFFESIDKITVEKNQSGSLVTYDAILLLNGPLRVFDFALKKFFNNLGDKAAIGLAANLEGELATHD